MSRLVVVSNRLADPRKSAAGGLAVALGETLKRTGGLWFGWSGKVVENGAPGEGELHVHQAGSVTLAELDLCQEDHDAYYRGYANGVLWPIFHYRLDLAHFESGHLSGYRRVNQLFARKLKALLKPDDLIWIHDYHRFTGNRWRAGRRRGGSAVGATTEIGYIPAGALELKAGSRQLFLECVFAARWTNGQCVVRHLLQHILGKTTRFAAIRVNRHETLRKNRPKP